MQALLARALIKSPSLLILDEPCQGLDEQQTAHFRGLIDILCKTVDPTLIYTSHYPEEIPDCVDRFLRLEQGILTESTSFISKTLQIIYIHNQNYYVRFIYQRIILEIPGTASENGSKTRKFVLSYQATSVSTYHPIQVRRLPINSVFFYFLKRDVCYSYALLEKGLLLPDTGKKRKGPLA